MERTRLPKVLAIGLLASTLLVLTGHGPDSTRAAFSGVNGSILYGSQGDIVAVNSDLTGFTKLTTGPALDGGPASSPDSAQIAFTSNRNGTFDIYVMNADGSNVVRVTTGMNASTVAWSPDGTHLAFTNDVGYNWEIYIVEVDGTGLTRLTNDPAADFGPSWSPDGTRIAFTSTRSGDSEIWAMNPGGNDLTRLTFNVGEDESPAWSPDGTRLAFARQSSLGANYTYTDIYTMNPDGSDQTNVTDTPGVMQLAPTWSPDGAKIAYARFGEYDGGGWFLYVIDADGQNVDWQGIDGDSFVHGPDWQPLVDTDGDGCSDARENGTNESLGGLRDYGSPWDFYDVNGDRFIDLANDILGVIQHYAPTGLAPYDVWFDRGPSAGPYAWSMTAPDGVIDLPNDVLGVILQFNHNCV